MPVSFIAVGLQQSGGSGGGGNEKGHIRVDGDYFRDETGALWRWRGASMFRLYHRVLLGEDISPQINWMVRQNVNVARVLGMVAWTGQEFGPTTPGYWEEMLPFVRHLGQRGVRIEWTAFADAQIVMPNQDQQRAHLDRVVNTIGPEWNVFIEIANEPFKNGVDPDAIWDPNRSRPCLMATGNYNIEDDDNPSLKTLDYVTLHTPRTEDSWCRKAKDLLEYRDGFSGWDGVQCPVVDDEPMGSAEYYKPGSRSNIPDDHFYHHAVAMIFSAGSTIHSDAGLQAEVPPAGGAQQACADAITWAWNVVSIDAQTGQYTRGGLDTLPLHFDVTYFPEDTSRLYGMITGGTAHCVACKPNAGWTAQAINGWSITNQHGPMLSSVVTQR